MDAKLIDAACQKAIATPFEWGKADCCTFVCDVLANMTGRDPMASLRGAYDSAESALEVYRAKGGFVEVVKSLAFDAGFIEVPAPYVCADFGVIESPRGPILAIWSSGKWVAKSLLGVAVYSRSKTIIAWRVK